MDTESSGSSQRFGHYELLELLGRGGMGEVYRARDTKTDRVVALKLLPPHLAQDAVFQQRFRREAHAAAGVNDPHVVPIHSYGEIDGRLYLDMRLVEGLNLGDILARRDKPLGTELAAVVVEQVASALDAAHNAGLVHRDVKPSNILISESEFVYLIDFGLARATTEPGITTTGNTLGTLAYMAPERFSGGLSDPRSDIYALTCVLYECLTGSRPYPSDSLEQQIAGHMVNPPPRPSDVDPALAAFDEVIEKGMAKDPERRYQTAPELAAATRRAVDRPRVRADRRSTGRSAHRATARTPSLRRRLAVIGAVVALVASVSTLAAWQLRSGPNERTRTASVSESTATVAQAAPADAVSTVADAVPAEIRATGRLVIGVNVPYAPNEFRDSYGELVGFDVDLMKAVARTMGLTPDFRETAFESILGSVQSGSFNLGMSSVTDTRERQQVVDFVNYFEAGTLWAQRPGVHVDPNDACGLRVGVAYAVIQETEEIPAKSAACVAAGRPPIEKVVYTRQDDLTAALIAGEVDAMSADSPVTGFAVKTSGGAIEVTGEVFDAGLYGWAVAKGSGLAEALRLALAHLIDTGEYRTIATMWGVERGMIDEPIINGASR
ncbi:bifunctional serine/threonine-protein kinase/transporter substrate-binding domain-containing protein [Mycobacterium sp. ACS4331]|uniref:bifunctional serine/threonine-protein kinase/transporter substrate-binding domain-containing protein n=1 Tax=Mycobacterium sp. ACS4331 TaxID=1834121 RepID=UPI000AE963D3|nr:bifunctional serine/threonine-protein kinase/transporter substrate-binding domain-containing protein [Mycobacterium sp. ACS4331]